jgi:hypothetical protein
MFFSFILFVGLVFHLLFNTDGLGSLRHLVGRELTFGADVAGGDKLEFAELSNDVHEIDLAAPCLSRFYYPEIIHDPIKQDPPLSVEARQLSINDICYLIATTIIQSLELTKFEGV